MINCLYEVNGTPQILMTSWHGNTFAILAVCEGYPSVDSQVIPNLITYLNKRSSFMSLTRVLQNNLNNGFVILISELLIEWWYHWKIKCWGFDNIPAPLFITQWDALPQDLAKSLSREIWDLSYPIALNLTGVSTTVLPSRLSNFRAVPKFLIDGSSSNG